MLTLMTAPAELRRADRNLQAAIQSADLQALDVLLDDRVIHVGSRRQPAGQGGPDRGPASGAMRIHRLDLEALDAVVDGTTGITRATLAISGHTAGVMYAWRVVITRTWTNTSGRWAVLAEHSSLVEPVGRAAEAAGGYPGPLRLV